MSNYIDDEINKEYEKLKTDKIVSETLINNTKNQFADMLLHSGIGEEIKNCNNYNTQYRLKLPFRIRIKKIINRIKKIL